MVFLYLFVYLFLGFIWVLIIHNKIEINNMLQPLALIFFWPIHIITYLITSII
jgi:hypothetical protein